MKKKTAKKKPAKKVVKAPKTHGEHLAILIRLTDRNIVAGAENHWAAEQSKRLNAELTKWNQENKKR